jgi:hypothetical protein
MCDTLGPVDDDLYCEACLGITANVDALMARVQADALRATERALRWEGVMGHRLYVVRDDE